MWVGDSFKKINKRLKHHQRFLTSRVFVIGNYVLPIVIYFLPCCKLPKVDLKDLFSLAFNFFWVQQEEVGKVPKVDYNMSTFLKEKFGSVLLDFSNNFSNMAIKRFIRVIECVDYQKALIKKKHILFPLRKTTFGEFSMITNVLFKEELILNENTLVCDFRKK